MVSNASVWDTVKLLPGGTLPFEFRQQAMGTPECDSFMHLHLGIPANVRSLQCPLSLPQSYFCFLCTMSSCTLHVLFITLLHRLSHLVHSTRSPALPLVPSPPPPSPPQNLPSGLDIHHIVVNDWQVGVDAPQNVVLLSLPSVLDPSLAPAGGACLHAYTPGTEPAALWEGLLPGSPAYQALKEERAEVRAVRGTQTLRGGVGGGGNALVGKLKFYSSLLQIL